MIRLIWAITWLLALFPGWGNAAGGSVAEQLAELGHPNTKMCNLKESSLGLGQLPFLQFEQKDTRQEELQEAVEILKLLADALISSGVRYVGFEASRRWERCQSRDPEFLFWRDDADNWRYMSEKPVRYLGRYLETLSEADLGTTKEAYARWSLGVVQQRTDRRKASLENIEAAYDILETSGDPNEILPFVLMPLMQHHLGEEGDAAKGQTYLEKFALISERSTAEGNYLPLFKVAPRYPAEAFERRIEGYVVLEFNVLADGTVRDPVVVEEAPAGVFGDAAIAAALEFRYVPKVEDGRMVSTEGVRNRITFEIE